MNIPAGINAFGIARGNLCRSDSCALGCIAYLERKRTKVDDFYVVINLTVSSMKTFASYLLMLICMLYVCMFVKLCVLVQVGSESIQIKFCTYLDLVQNYKTSSELLNST